MFQWSALIKTGRCPDLITSQSLWILIYVISNQWLLVPSKFSWFIHTFPQSGHVHSIAHLISLSINRTLKINIFKTELLITSSLSKADPSPGFLISVNGIFVYPVAQTQNIGAVFNSYCFLYPFINVSAMPLALPLKYIPYLTASHGSRSPFCFRP